jgi:hypothetical protein
MQNMQKIALLFHADSESIRLVLFGAAIGELEVI